MDIDILIIIIYIVARLTLLIWFISRVLEAISKITGAFTKNKVLNRIAWIIALFILSKYVIIILNAFGQISTDLIYIEFYLY